ncbi:hypothetical protein CNY89_06130 [Amaricoccus sp. HAR-UPW-R2A-40]|nr:hypothetical protein CNY89_06130 [Amaricoccus sp. HAR-UPW-R2A-40]
MADKFKGISSGTSGPAVRHFLITPSDSVDLDPRPRLIYCAAAGTIVVRDAAGTDLSYTLERGDRLEFRGVRVMAAGTTGTWYGWI